ncbi:SAF domain-containing protein [Brucella pseudogrignonensis]|uniref:Homoserine dehydrogenase-like protein n=1 Tax=Brucella pseudogrignonensis TaxID=419475 RepID=A0ABU1MDR0_9HYPH|nr:SAF domain-containing protein [Brucella pseudogrignonensis]MDR6434189.1 putative homoserine dehydrogenase-like protein [Brucella pseudogrignonensis]
MVYHHLYEQFSKATTVRVGVIGAGNYGTAIVTQEPYTDRLTILAIADISVDAARGAFEKAGLDMSQVVYCSTVEEAEVHIREGRRVYTDHPEIIPQLSAVDIVCESTGVPEASARFALDAIAHRKHVAMITKDCDVVVGPILKHKAKEAGLVYTPVDGDQHGLLIQLFEWAKSIGLTVLSGGKATDGEYVYDKDAGTVSIRTEKKIHPPYVETVSVSAENRKYLDFIPEGQADLYTRKRAEILAQLPQPGCYDLCEITVAANYTGMKPAISSLVHAPLRITEIPVVYCEKSNGGIFDHTDTIDLATCLRAPEEAGLGGGVFIVVRCDNNYSNHILTTKGQIANYDDTAAVIYRPYHLCGVETSTSLLMAGLLGIDTGSGSYFPHFDLVKVAARDIKAGEVFGNDHSPMMTALIIEAKPVAMGNPAAAHLLTGNQAAVDIPAGTVITYDMVVEPESSTIWPLRREQDALFLTTVSQST